MAVSKSSTVVMSLAFLLSLNYFFFFAMATDQCGVCCPPKPKSLSPLPPPAPPPSPPPPPPPKRKPPAGPPPKRKPPAGPPPTSESKPPNSKPKPPPADSPPGPPYNHGHHEPPSTQTQTCPSNPLIPGVSCAATTCCTLLQGPHADLEAAVHCLCNALKAHVLDINININISDLKKDGGNNHHDEKKPLTIVKTPDMKKQPVKKTPVKTPVKKKQPLKKTPVKTPVKKKQPVKKTPVKTPVKKKQPVKKIPVKSKHPAKKPVKVHAVNVKNNKRGIILEDTIQDYNFVTIANKGLVVDTETGQMLSTHTYGEGKATAREKNGRVTSSAKSRKGDNARATSEIGKGKKKKKVTTKTRGHAYSSADSSKGAFTIKGRTYGKGNGKADGSIRDGSIKADSNIDGDAKETIKKEHGITSINTITGKDNLKADAKARAKAKAKKKKHPTKSKARG